MELTSGKHREIGVDHGNLEYDWHVYHRPALERDTLHIALEGIGTPAVVNVIAAVGCFAFMATAVEVDGAIIAALKWPSITFASGFGLAGVAFVLACLTMHCTSGASYLAQTNRRFLRRCALGSHYLALLMVMMSYCLLFVGVYLAQRAIWH